MWPLSVSRLSLAHSFTRQAHGSLHHGLVKVNPCVKSVTQVCAVTVFRGVDQNTTVYTSTRST